MINKMDIPNLQNIGEQIRKRRMDPKLRKRDLAVSSFKRMKGLSFHALGESMGRDRHKNYGEL
jgi:hypothetical protein